jgi:vacuolar protein sorting-associated protein 11
VIPEFKVWNLNKLNGSIPACVRSAKTNIQRPSALGVSESGQYLAIGFERGNLTVYFGEISRDKTKAVKNMTFGNSAIKGIVFKQIGTKIVHMFACSDSGVYLYTIHGRDKEMKNVLDTVSANNVVTCCCLQTTINSDGYFMVGRDDAIYCYTTEGRASCYAFDGRKVLIRWFRTHLLMVTTALRDNNSHSSTLTVIDVTNRFIVFSAQIEAVASVFVENGSCFILTKDKLMYHLDEKDLQSKLNSLYKKNMFDTAVKIAKSSQYDEEGLSNIFKNYADHLYSKGNFGGAIEQYIKTIGFLEPSYVIRRFLDPRHTQFLTDYLQNIHKLGKATNDHTTLLLNCFTRLDRIEELKLFLENYKQNNFDISVAISVCRKSCIEQALDLAKFNRQHDHTITILIEDLKSYEEAIKYMSDLSYDEAEKNVIKYGNLLMIESPQRLIGLLKKLCTDFIAKKCDETTGNSRGEENSLIGGLDGFRNTAFSLEHEQATPEDFIHFFGDSKQLIDYIEYLVRNLPNCSKFLYNTLIEHYLTLWKISDNPSNEKVGLEQRIVDLIKNHIQFYDHNHVLILCQTYEFWLGAMLIYEEKKLFNLIVRHYLNTKDYSSLYTLCKRLGTTDPSIWLHTLNGLRLTSQVPSTFLQEILQVRFFSF